MTGQQQFKLQLSSRWGKVESEHASILQIAENTPI